LINFAIADRYAEARSGGYERRGALTNESFDIKAVLHRTAQDLCTPIPMELKY